MGKVHTAGIFAIRLLLSTVLVSLFMILTQDIQIFPGVVDGLFDRESRSDESLPRDVESIFITTRDSETLEVWHVRAEPVAKHVPTQPVAILFHGNAETVDSVYHLQRWLQSLGMHSLSFDYRGYGNSTGWPSDRGIKADVQAVVDFAITQYNPEKHTFILLGVSIGSGLAAHAATMLQEPILVLISPYVQLKTLVSELPFFGFLHPFLWYDFNTEAYIKAANSVCTIIVHGMHDSTIPFSHSERLIASITAQEKVFFIPLEDAGHNDAFAKSYEAIASYITQCADTLQSSG